MANLKQGLITSLNQMREMSVNNNSIYHQYVPIITENTDIGTFGTPILNNPSVANEFMNVLINRIVYTQFETKYFRNPLQVLEGDRIPLGYEGQEIFVNPAKGRKYNVEDFAGLLQKYEADVKVQYTAVNMDLQYPVTVTRHKLKQAFVSWEALDSFITELSNSLYNGAYIDEYRFTKELVAGAYKNNIAQIVEIQEPNTEALAKAFITQARTLYLNFQTPSSKYNAWTKVGGYGKPITTFTRPEDIVFLIRNDILSYVDVNVLALALNIDKTTLLGNILPVDNFDIYDDDGNLIFDGKNMFGFIGDKSWFRIKRQDMYLDEFYNANNRTWQYYLNVTKMYNYSLFANGVIFATSTPNVSITSLQFENANPVKLETGVSKTLTVTVNPVTANTPEISFTTDNEELITLETVAENPHQIKVTPKEGAEGKNTLIHVTAGNVTTSIIVLVQEA